MQGEDRVLRARPASALLLALLALPPAAAYGAMPLVDDDLMSLLVFSALLLFVSARLLLSREPAALRTATWIASAGPLLAVLGVVQAGHLIDNFRYDVTRFAWAAIVHAGFGIAMLMVSRAPSLKLWYISKAERDVLEG